MRPQPAPPLAQQHQLLPAGPTRLRADLLLLLLC
jgi:hypothetical protein